MWIKQQRATSYCKGTEMGQRFPCGWPGLPAAAGVDHAASSAPYTVAEAEMAGFSGALANGDQTREQNEGIRRAC